MSRLSCIELTREYGHDYANEIGVWTRLILCGTVLALSVPHRSQKLGLGGAYQADVFEVNTRDNLG